MGKPRIIKESHNVGFYVMEAYEGKTIEQRCREMVETGEPIKDTSPLIYTPKEKGVRPEYNVRADKWDIAQEAMNAVNREKIAKGNIIYVHIHIRSMSWNIHNLYILQRFL